MININYISRRKIWYSLSGIMILVSLISIGIFGLNYGLDFTGGSLIEINYSIERPATEQITSILSEFSLDNSRIQPSDQANFIIRLAEIDEATHQQIITSIKALAASIDPENIVVETRFESFGPSLGQELRRSALYAIIFALLAIIIYVAYAFRKVSKPVASWKFGSIAVIALIHDAIIVVGLFAILGFLFEIEIDSFFVTALLTLLGFSVHDTIVTLDRVRENLSLHRDKSFEEIVNLSINRTVTRSINTSITTLFALVAIFLFGGHSIQSFSLALISGVIIGTYSSLFVAAPLLVTWNSRKKVSTE